MFAFSICFVRRLRGVFLWIFVACLWAGWGKDSGVAGDLVTYVGGAGSQRFTCAHRLSDGTVLVGGQADGLGWVPAGVPVVEMGAGGIQSASSGKVGFLVRFSADLSSMLGVVHFPQGTVEDIARIRSSEVPGESTGGLVISGRRTVVDTTQDGYYLAKLNGNFVSTAVTGVDWTFNVVCPPRGTSASGYKNIQPWDVRTDGLVVYAFGTENASTWSALRVLGTNGQPTTMPGWVLVSGTPSYSELPLRVTSQRSTSQEDFDAILPDGNGGWKKGRNPNDFYHATPSGVTRGYTGYTFASSSYGISQISIDRRTNRLFFGNNVQTSLPHGLPDFEPAVAALDDQGALMWWSRLYTEMVMADGVSRSTDGAVTWTASNSGLTNRFVLSLAADPLMPGTVYAGTHGGVFKSTDAGATWTAVNSGLGNLRVTALVVHPSNPSTVYAGTAGGVFKSVNGGASWTAVSTGLSTLYINALAIHPTSPDTLYAGTAGGGVFKTTDGGGTWSAVNNGLGSDAAHLWVYALAIDPSAPNTVYLGSAGGNGVSRTSDGGANWVARGTGLTNTCVFALAVNPAVPSTLFVGTNWGIHRSTDAGAAWAAVGSWTVFDSYQNKTVTVNGPVRSIVVDPLNTSRVYAGFGYRGARVSTDGGVTWVAANTGLASNNNTSQEMGNMVHALAPDPTTAGRLYLGSLGLPHNSTPDQYVDSVEVDYSKPAGQAEIGVIARSHGNDFSSLWDGNTIAPAQNPANPGYAYHNAFSGDSGNVHLSWAGKLAASSGTLMGASRIGEYAEGAYGFGSAYTDPLLDGWPSHNSGWPDLNTTKTDQRMPAFDSAGRFIFVGTGRRTHTTTNAFQRMPNPQRLGTVASGASTTGFQSTALIGNAMIRSGASTVTFTSGSNNNQTRTISGFNPFTGAVTLSTPLGAAPATGATFKLSEGLSSWNQYVRAFSPDMSTLAYSSVINGAWDTATQAGGDNTYLAQAIPMEGGVLVVGYHKASGGVAAGNPVPTMNLPSYGLSTPNGETAILARLSFDPVPTVFLGATTAITAESAAQGGKLSLLRSGGDVAQPLTVAVSVGGAAANGVDYLPALSGTVTFPANVSAVDLEVNPVDDALSESGEEVTLALLSGTNYRVGPVQSGTVTIVDNDSEGTFGFGASSYSVAENGGSVTVTVNRSGGNFGAASVRVSSSDGSASAPADYGAVNTMLSWAAGEFGPKTLTVPVVYDGLQEGNESLQLGLSEAVGAVISGGGATVVINDYFVPGTLQFSAPEYGVGEDAQTATVFVTRTGGQTGVVSADFATGDFTALNGTDYLTAAGTLTWGHLDSAPKSFTVRILDNATLQAARSLYLQLSRAQGGVALGQPDAVLLSIADDDAFGTVQFSGTVHVVSESGTAAEVGVVRTGGSVGAVSVQFATADATAVAGVDYTATSGTLSWGAGETGLRTFQVPVTNRAGAQPDRALVLALSAPGGGVQIGERSAASLAITETNGAALTWTNGSGDRLWNTTSVNWTGARTTFVDTDAVLFSGTGLGTVKLQPAGVRPSSTTVHVASGTNCQFTGGDLAGGRLEKTGNGTARFTGYAGSLGFSGGTRVVSGLLEFQLAPQGVTVGFGTGPIVLQGGTFSLFASASQNAATTTLTNPLVSGSNTSVLRVNRSGSPKLVFAGDVQLDADLTLDCVNGGGTGVDQHELAGKITVSGTRLLRRVNTGNTNWALTGNVVDGVQPGTLRLQNSGGRIYMVKGTANTFSGGTVIVNTGQTLADPSVTTAYYVQVAANSSLGSGDVTVENRGYLHLRGQNNLGRGAALTVASGGAVYVDNSVVVTVRSLTLGGTTHYSGQFTAATAPGFVYGAGAIQVIPPTVTLEAVRDEADPAVPGTARTGLVVVRRTGSLAGSLAVNLQVSGSAQPGVDYAALPAQVTIPQGSEAVELLVDPLREQTSGPRDVTVALASGAYEITAPGQVRVMLRDPASPGVMEFSAASGVVEEGGGTVQLVVRRRGGAAGAVSVVCATNHGTAVSGGDFAGISQTLSWAAGEGGAKTAVVSLVDDAVVEFSETFGAVLSAPSGGAALGTPSAMTLLILDNDGRRKTWSNGAANGLWDTASSNWSGLHRVFEPGDDVTFSDAAAGAVSLVGDVFPSAITLDHGSGDYTFTGGRVMHGSIVKEGSRTAAFNGATSSFEFSGGAVVRAGTLQFGAGAPLASLRFGTGSVTIDGGRFAVLSTATANAQISTFLNAINVTASGGTLYLNRSGGNPKTVVSGPISVGGNLALEVVGGGGTGVDRHELTGTMTLHGAKTLTRLGHGNTNLGLAGNMVDGGQPGALTLLNSGGRTLIVAGTANTYSGGTTIAGTGQTIDPNVTTAYYVEVASASSLGSGHVTVANKGYLRLRGTGNLAPASYLAISTGGAVYLDSGITARVRRLVLGGTTHLSGTFTSANSSGLIYGAGAVRVVPALMAWREMHFPNGQFSGNTEDPDGDGNPNLMEYALMGNPNLKDNPPFSLVVAGNRLRLVFPRDPQRDDVTLTVEGAGAAGGPWTPVARSTQGGAFVPMTGGASVFEVSSGNAVQVTVDDAFTFPDPSRPQRFLRLRAE